ncbi:hypothetical protein GCM10010502_02890 [Kitasatospora aureofaciens]|uniref:Uncharacterized protein n=1 Tax=Kitasatospora aureofaciens TaxID=1894 RepID=A0A8H9HCA3_KITAU|nr:hypothetical protein GCM10010502_02890 [Kitasatospora aureofaciens]
MGSPVTASDAAALMFSSCIWVTFKVAWLAVSLVGFRLGHCAPLLHDVADGVVADAVTPLPAPSDAKAAAITATVLRPTELMSTPMGTTRA